MPISDLDLSGIRVLATDLDGTLLRADHTVSDRTRGLIADAITAGIRIVFVTGRPPRWMRAVGEATGHAGTAVCANGAVVLDMAEEQVVTSHAISALDLARSATAVAGLMGPDTLFAAEQAPTGSLERNCLRHEPGFIPTEFQARLGHDFRPEPRDVLLQQPAIVKLLARGTGPVAETEHAARAVQERVGDHVTVTHSSKTHQLLEIAPGGITKATGLAELVRSWGLAPQQVIAVGDMPNDAPMLAWAGSGVAVSSAHHSLAAVVAATVADPEHDGVADLLTAILSVR